MITIEYNGTVIVGVHRILMSRTDNEGPNQLPFRRVRVACYGGVICGVDSGSAARSRLLRPLCGGRIRVGEREILTFAGEHQVCPTRFQQAFPCGLGSIQSAEWEADSNSTLPLQSPWLFPSVGVQWTSVVGGDGAETLQMEAMWRQESKDPSRECEIMATALHFFPFTCREVTIKSDPDIGVPTVAPSRFIYRVVATWVEKR